MYEVAVEVGFSASHAVRLPNGEMEPLHSHDWLVTVVFQGTDLDDDGLLVDFVAVQERLTGILQPLEGANLNDHPFLEGRAASAEHIARRVFTLLGEGERTAARLEKVIIREAPGCSASYSGG